MDKRYIKNRTFTVITREIGYQVTRLLRKYLRKTFNGKRNNGRRK